MTAKQRGPEVFALEEEPRLAATIREEADFTATPEPRPELSAVRRGSWLTRAFWSALGLLVSLFLFDAVWSLILSLYAKSVLAGQMGLALIGIIGLVMLVWLLREVFALMRLKAVADLREEARGARLQPAEASARALTARLLAFYAKDATTAAGRLEIERSLAEIHDPETRLAIAERALFAEKDNVARAMIAGAAQRVSVVTAVSPRALVDVAFVLAQAVMLIRQLSALYGGRASGLALLGLVRRVAGHLLVTGGMAAAEQVLGQVMGAGLAARLSAKLGEGLMNGVLTARIGIAALEACRPMEFGAVPSVFLSEVVKKMISQEKVAEKAAG
jgi:putative membrane protein